MIQIEFMYCYSYFIIVVATMSYLQLCGWQQNIELLSSLFYGIIILNVNESTVYNSNKKFKIGVACISQKSYNHSHPH